MTTQTPSADDLETMIFAFDVHGIREALANGAQADDVDSEGCPLVITASSIMASKPGKTLDSLSKSAEIATLFFEAGANPNDTWQPVRWGDDNPGLVYAIDRVMASPSILGAGEAWDATPALALVDAWLRAGADPNPVVHNNGDKGGLIDHIIQPMIRGRNKEDSDLYQLSVLLMAKLARYGCPVSPERLRETELDDDQVDRAWSAIEKQLILEQTLEAGGGFRAYRL